MANDILFKIVEINKPIKIIIILTGVNIYFFVREKLIFIFPKSNNK